MTYPGGGLFPGPGVFPGGGGPGPDLSGNPTGIDESSYWGTLDSTRPDTLRWLAVDLLSGAIITDLPSMQSTDPNRRTLNQYESQSIDMYVTDTTTPSWRVGTRPGSCAVIAYRGDPGVEVIYWGGIVLRRQSTTGSNKVTLTAATPEAYLDRRYTGAYTTDPLGIGATKPQNSIVADLITQFVVANQGLPITVVTLAGTSTSRFEVYNDYDDKTVYSNIGALTGLLGGPEFTGHWVWNRGPNTITPVLYVGNRIGTPASPAPAATFDSANLIEGTLDENYSTGMGGNDVTATSSGQGLARPQATSPNPPSTTLNGRPRFQYRYSPSTSIQDPLTLQQHADRAASLLTEGTNTVTLKAAASSRPLLGVDWNLGDDIGYELDGPAFPTPLIGVARCIGYEATDVYTSPVLYIPQVN